ncbi:hypothetical protein [Pseudonocardia endophytica]|uniref:Uncharacterized protein n=1 Tax=Pseudonocardia endophytica TaxID=401976 RepID=A0A4R1HX85_PSEEN|nr:hypothetical protein [Pseudonocardia endophytica]TCK27367.1 hypothetical protein EV378_3238 [Pseudonocardia endophytica]
MAGNTDDELGDAVDDALTDEVKRQKARFVQAFLGADRFEGVGRAEGEAEDRLRHELGLDRPEDPDG